VSERKDTSGRDAIIFSLSLTAVLGVAVFMYQHFRSPDGARAAWLVGDLLVVEEFREDEDSAVSRLVVLDPRTGKRQGDRSPDGLSVFALAGGRLWLQADRAPYGIEGWGLPSLKTEITAELKAADSNVCSDGAYARVKLTDGTYAVLELGSGKVVGDREVSCRSSHPSGAESSGASSRGRLSSHREASSERMHLLAAETRLAGSSTFLEPRFLLDEGRAVELDGDVFVLHRVELGNNRAMQLSRVGENVKWTVPIAEPGSVHAALLVKSETLVFVGHHGITTIDVQSGNVLWRTGG
jgi:hypothetical protein